jgi:hypothetical protein
MSTQSSPRRSLLLGGALALLALALPLQASADPQAFPLSLRSAVRQALSSRAELRKIRREVGPRPEGEAALRLGQAIAKQKESRTEVVSAFKRTAPVQILRGIGRGPSDTWQTLKQHPFKVIGATVLLGGVSLGLELLNLPATPIMLGACSLLTLRAVKQGYPEVRDAFRAKTPERFELLGERVLFPTVAYVGATTLTLTIGGAVESLSGSQMLAEGSKGVAYGIHIIDDIPSIAASLGGAAQKAKGKGL